MLAKRYNLVILLQAVLISSVFAQTTGSSGSSGVDWIDECANDCSSFFDQVADDSATNADICSGLSSDGSVCTTCVQNTNATGYQLVDTICPSVVASLAGGGTSSQGATGSSTADMSNEMGSGVDWIDECANDCSFFFDQVADDSATNADICSGLSSDGSVCTTCVQNTNATGYQLVDTICPSVVASFVGSGTSTQGVAAASGQPASSATSTASMSNEMGSGVDWIDECASDCSFFFDQVADDSATNAEICSGLSSDGSVCTTCVQNTNATGYQLVDTICPSVVASLAGSSTSAQSVSTASSRPASSAASMVDMNDMMGSGVDWIDDCQNQCEGFFEGILDDQSSTDEACSGLMDDGTTCTSCVRGINATGYSQLRTICPDVFANLVSGDTTSSTSNTASSAVGPSTVPAKSGSAGPSVPGPSQNLSTGVMVIISMCLVATGFFF